MISTSSEQIQRERNPIPYFLLRGHYDLQNLQELMG